MPTTPFFLSYDAAEAHQQVGQRIQKTKNGYLLLPGAALVDYAETYGAMIARMQNTLTLVEEQLYQHRHPGDGLPYKMQDIARITPLYKSLETLSKILAQPQGVLHYAAQETQEDTQETP